MSLFKHDFKEILVSQMAALLGGTVVGSLLALYTDKLLLIPGMLILLPGFLEMRGNISGTFAARLTSGLFLSVIKPDHIKSRIIKGNLIASFLLAIAVSGLLGVIAFTFSYITLHIFMPRIILLPLLAGLIANTIEITLTLFGTLYFFKRGNDPNNIMGPIITSTGDFTSVLALLIAVVII